MALALNSQGSQFVYSFPVDFVPAELEKKYKNQLERTHSVFDDVIDYLNNTIQGINFPGLTFPTVVQTHKFGKEINYRAAKAPYDTYTREFTVDMESIDNKANYFMMQDILMWHYINTNVFVNPFMILILDQNRQEQWRYELREVVMTEITASKFGYQETSQEKDVFSIKFKCNFIDNVYVPELNLPKLIKTKL